MEKKEREYLARNILFLINARLDNFNNQQHKKFWYFLNIYSFIGVINKKEYDSIRNFKRTGILW